MATRLARIPVTEDPALVEEKQERARELAWVAEVTTSPRVLWDPEIMARLDELAWGISPEDA